MTGGIYQPQTREMRLIVRRQLWRAQGRLCPLCGGILGDFQDAGQTNFDHVWPKSQLGGRNKLIGNLLLAHERCNARKRDSLPTGCELIMLHAVNRRLGFTPHETALWDGPTALAARARGQSPRPKLKQAA